MSAGRKPLPLTVHKMNGNPSKKSFDELYAPEHDLDENMPEPPSEVTEDKEALEEWNRIVPELHRAGIVKNIDRTALTQYCCAYSEWSKALRSCRHARLIRKKDGTLLLNPSFKIVREMSALMVKLLSEFGMTPSSRVRLKPSGKKSTDPLDDESFGD